MPCPINLQHSPYPSALSAFTAVLFPLRRPIFPWLSTQLPPHTLLVSTQLLIPREAFSVHPISIRSISFLYYPIFFLRSPNNNSYFCYFYLVFICSLCMSSSRPHTSLGQEVFLIFKIIVDIQYYRSFRCTTYLSNIYIPYTVMTVKNLVTMCTKLLKHYWLYSLCYTLPLHGLLIL